MLKDVVINDNIKLAVCDTPGEKGTIIAVHGLTGNHKTFDHYRNLLEGDYRFISYDLRGRGNSSPADEQTTLFLHAEDLKTFIKEQGIEQPILLGYSMGAYICAQVASEIDVKALILLDGAGTTEERQRALIVPSLSRLRKEYESEEDYVAQTKAIYESLHVPWDDMVEGVTRYEVKKTADSYRHKSEASAMEKDFTSFYDFEPQEVFKRISCPILLVIAYGKLGQKDSLFTRETYDETLVAAKDITSIEVPANHYTLMFEQQPEVEKSILKFLNDEEVKK
ncbi:alpha/beta hydrolase [Sporosarcina sp. PTS2304]|uniref:alpha/beta fold hydrolase n=1 Tax=Sporosarcina sp. PTS2304 TaxID=2283194 RepID=UPI000E0D5E89|nr:alpha/beta hydrolase [Sporosarcina sp. PTS2304]AXI00241.1 alpha/beta hydrolase [Sporosarcina sp. PTS2304]